MINPEVNRYIPTLHPFIDYVFEDKRHYPTATSAGFIDPDNDFLIGDSSGFLMNMDFVFVNTHLFNEVSTNFMNSGRNDEERYYCADHPKSVGYKEFWKRETHRRRKGMEIMGKLPRKYINEYNACKTDADRYTYLLPLRITGDHYNYLNYGRIQRTPTKEEREVLDKLGKTKQTFVSGFPRIWDGDYWNFKVDEFVANNGFHLCKAKARRKGYSNKRGSQGANTINLNPGITIIFAAYDSKYLTDAGATTDMLKINLDWYENKTFWKRGYLSEDYSNIELGYKLQKEGNKKFGFRSKALSVSCQNNPDAAIGKAAVEVDFEEAGKFPNVQQAIEITASATEVGDESVGTMRVYGTGGTKDSNWFAFSKMYYNPRNNRMMPFENVWDENMRHNVCGFFHPQILNYEPFMDSDGNSFLVKSFLSDKTRKDEHEKNSTVVDHAVYCSQRANSPSEAFNNDNENLFSSHELNAHIKYIRAISSQLKYRDGQYVVSGLTESNKLGSVSFVTNTELKEQGTKIHPYIESVPFTSKDDVYGCWRHFHEPKKIDGKVPDNLYYILVDPVGKDKNIKEVTTKNSLNAIYVLSYPNTIGVPPDEIQAIYVGRRDDSLTACSREALNASLYWNGKVLPEIDRGSIVADFKFWKAANRLLKNPLVVGSSKVVEGTPGDYGIYIGDGSNAVDSLINLKNYLYEAVNVDDDGNRFYRLHYINDLPTLLELQQFNSKGNFDRVSAYRLAPFQRTAFTLKRMHTNIKTAKTFLSGMNLYRK
jgi:hypothetical protein